MSEKCTCEGERSWPVRVVAASRDGTYIVAGDQSRTVRIRTAGREKEPPTFVCDLINPSGTTAAMLFAKDGGFLLTGGSAKKLFRWPSLLWQKVPQDCTKPEVLAEVETPITTVALGNMEKRVAVGSSDGSVSVFNLETKERLSKFRVDGEAADLRFSPNDRQLVAGGHKSLGKAEVGVYNVENGKRIDGIASASNYVLSLAISPTGRRLLFGTLDGFEIWDLIDGRRTNETKLENDGVSATTFSPDGKMFAVGTLSGGIHLYDARTVAQCSDLNAAEPSQIHDLVMAHTRPVIHAGAHNGNILSFELNMKQALLAMLSDKQELKE